MGNTSPKADAELGDTERVIFAITCALVLLTSMIMNSLVCFVMYRNKQLRHQFSSAFIINLAVCDFLKASLVMPFSFGAMVRRHSAADNYWPWGRTLCYIIAFTNQTLAISSILTLVVISVDRFYAVIRPLQYRAKMTMNKALVSVAYVWAQAFVFSALPAALSWYMFNERYFLCTFGSNVQNRTQIVFGFGLYSANFGLPLVVMLFAYYKIFRVARRHSLRVAPAVVALGSFGTTIPPSFRRHKELGRQREAKAARKILLVIATFIVCSAPYTTLRVLELAQPSGSVADLHHAVTIFTTWLNFLKSLLNPVIYGFLQKRFRTTLSRSILPNRDTAMARYPFLRRVILGGWLNGAVNNNNNNEQSHTTCNSQGNGDRRFGFY